MKCPEELCSDCLILDRGAERVPDMFPEAIAHLGIGLLEALDFDATWSPTFSVGLQIL